MSIAWVSFHTRSTQSECCRLSVVCVVLLVWVKRQSERENTQQKQRHKVLLVVGVVAVVVLAFAFVVILVFTAALLTPFTADELIKEPHAMS